MAENQNPGKGDEKKAVSMIRIHGTDIDGSKSMLTGVACVKGVGNNLAHAILRKLDINPNEKLGILTDPQILTIENAIDAPGSLGIPVWMFNRRKDLETGEDIHLKTSDLDFAKKQDFDVLGETKSFRGLREARGLKHRGQRTKSTGRGTTAVGVKRKKH